MLRTMISLPFRLFSTAEPIRYQIFKLAYLIQAPPKRPVPPYALFLKQESAQNKSLSLESNRADLKQKWNNTPGIKDKFKKMSQETGKDYPQKLKQYTLKYVTPFKRVTQHTLGIKKAAEIVKAEVLSGQKIQNGIEGYGKKIQTILKNSKLEQKQALKKEALKIKGERQKIINQYKFPMLAYKSFRAYQLRNSIPTEQRGPTYMEDLRKGYNQYLLKWRGEVQEWLKNNNYKITVDQFTTLYEKTLAAEKERKESVEEQDEQDGQ